MNVFEISSKKNKNGRRHFKTILYRIFPDSCVDEVNRVGTKYNKNGITWLREYCEKALPSIEGMSLRCEFIDEERTEPCGHGATGIEDNTPVFEDAVVIGTFTKGYIEEVETDEGVITACIGEGEIDAQCYHNFVSKLEADIKQGIFPCGSIEIMRTADNDEIKYKYGYKDKGRIPTEFIHSGYALLGILPADDSAKLIELNEKHKEELDKMTDMEIKAIVSQVVDELSAHTSEINKCKEECEAKIAEFKEAMEKAIAEKNEIEASSEETKAALKTAEDNFKELNSKWDELCDECETLKKALADARAKERLGALNAAIADFTDEQKAFAQAEIDAFNADPNTSEIDSVVDKIWIGIGKAAKDAENKVAEQNSADTNIEDIFSGVETADTSHEDINIF